MTPDRVEAIPREMRERPQWLRRRGKVPWHATEDRPGSSTDPATWSTLDAALARVGQHGTDGVGFAFAPDDGLVGVDLDHAITDAGTLEPWAAEIVAAFRTYAEVSLSGSGVHVIARGELPGGRGRKRAGVELYDRGRFFVVTGDVLDGAPREITTANGALTRLLESFSQTSTADTTTATVSTNGKPRHDFLLAKACDLARVPLHSDAILAALRVLRDQVSTDGARPITDAELAGIVRWAVERVPDSAAPAAGWRNVLGKPVTLDRWRDARPPEWTVEGVVQRAALTFLSAFGGVGKSLVIEDLLLRLASRRGGLWLGTYAVSATDAVVAYIEAENGRARLERRALELVMGGAFEAAEIDAALPNLRVFPADSIARRDLVFEALPALLDEHPEINVIAVDPLRSFLPSTTDDENDNVALGRVADQLVALALQRNVPVIVSDHDNRSGGALRGASAKRDAACFLLHLEASEASPDLITAKLEKARDPGGEKRFVLRRVGQPKTADGFFPVRFERVDPGECPAPDTLDAADLKIVRAVEHAFGETKTGAVIRRIAELAGLSKTRVGNRVPHLVAVGALYQPEKRGGIYPNSARREGSCE